MTHLRLTVAAAIGLLLVSADASATFWDDILHSRKPNLRYGQVRFHPYFSTTGTYDDNIYRVTRDRPDGTRHGCNPGNSVQPPTASTCSGGFMGSWIVSNNLGLITKLPVGNHRFSLKYDMRTDNFKLQPKANDAISQGLSARWDFKGARVRARAWDDYLNTEDPPYNPNSMINGELVTRETRWNNEAGLGAEYFLGDKFFVEVVGSITRHKYLSPTLAALIDRSLIKFSGRAGYKIFPKTRVFAGVERKLTRYSAGRNANHKDWYSFFGIEGNLAPKLKGSFRNGVHSGRYDVDETSVETTNQRRTPTLWVAEARLVYKVSQRTSVTLTGNSSVEEAVVGGNFYLSRGLTLNASHRVRKLTLRGLGAFRIDKFSETILTEAAVGVRIGLPGQRRDDNYTVGIGFDYEIYAWLKFSAGFKHMRRHSILSRQFNYKANQTSLSLKATF